MAVFSQKNARIFSSTKVKEQKCKPCTVLQNNIREYKLRKDTVIF